MPDPVHPSLRQKNPQHLKTGKRSDKVIHLGRKNAAISRAPLKRQNSSDAWNERQNRLIAGRDAARSLMKGYRLRNQGK